MSPMNSTTRLAVLLATLAAHSAAAAVVLQLPPFLASHMVLQRAPAAAKLWGTAAPGAKITVSGDPNHPHAPPISASGTAGANGAWTVSLPPQKASVRVQLKVSDGASSVTLEDVAFGDVFVCTGQSNMAFSVRGAFNHSAEIADSGRFANLRLATVNNSQSPTPRGPMNGTGSMHSYDWAAASPAAFAQNGSYVGGGGVSAVCYFFGRDLYVELGESVPIGIISAAIGGVKIATMASADALSDDTCGGTRADAPVAPPPSKEPFPGASELWNAMVNPLLQMRLSGVVVYQGESNDNWPEAYSYQWDARQVLAAAGGGVARPLPRGRRAAAAVGAAETPRRRGGSSGASAINCDGGMLQDSVSLSLSLRYAAMATSNATVTPATLTVNVANGDNTVGKALVTALPIGNFSAAAGGAKFSQRVNGSASGLKLDSSKGIGANPRGRLFVVIQVVNNDRPVKIPLDDLGGGFRLSVGWVKAGQALKSDDAYAGLKIWPKPKSEVASGQPMALDPNFSIKYSGSSAVARTAAERYTKIIQDAMAAASASASVRSGAALKTLLLTVGSDSDVFTNWTVDESYGIKLVGGAATASAKTPFGLLRACETFSQLLEADGSLPHETITIDDAPTYSHRGILLDLSRRLYPLTLMRSILDAMSYTKLNVLHLHLSDYGRFAVESKVFPELNVGYAGDGRYWKQSDVRKLIQYAKLRGVRLVPEVEMPAHAKALFPLAKTQGLKFCNDSFPVFLLDDQAGKTVSVLQTLVAEVAGLFVDDVMHLGMDEADCFYSDPAHIDPLNEGSCGLPQICNGSTTASLEHKMLKYTADVLRKRPMAWHNAMFDCGDKNGCDTPGAPKPATDGVPTTIIECYVGEGANGSALLAKNATARGYLATQANAGRLYLDNGPTSPAAYNSAFYYDINQGTITDPEQLKRLLGGSMSLWSDNYCSVTAECGGWAQCPGGKPATSCLHSTSWMQPEKEDAAFIQSAGGLLFPRSNVGAGSFWHFNEALKPNGPEFLARTAALAKIMDARGVLGLCPPGCSCSFGGRCGADYKPAGHGKAGSVKYDALLKQADRDLSAFWEKAFKSDDGLATAVAREGPCDIFAKGGTPCAAAHAMTRALFGAYIGRLYELKLTKTNETLDIKALPGGLADSASHRKFCSPKARGAPPCPYPPAPCHYPSRADCVVSKIYDQTGNGNHMLPANPAINNPAYCLPVNATRHPISICGHLAYGAYFETGMGYRARNTSKVVKTNDAETVYMVTSGTHLNTGCCFDYGNSEEQTLNHSAYGRGNMEAVYFGTGYGGGGKGPWIGADLEVGIYGGPYNASDTALRQPFVTAMIKGGTDGFAVKGGSAMSGGSLQKMYDGPRPEGYQPMRKAGAIILGVGGDNAKRDPAPDVQIPGMSIGTFYEGVLTVGYSTDAADAAVQTNIVAAGYGK